MRSLPRGKKLPASALTLLKRLCSHAEARMESTRVYPLDAQYRLFYQDDPDKGLTFLEHRDENALAILAEQGAVLMSLNNSIGNIDTRRWEVTQTGRDLLARAGIVYPPPPPAPSLFSPDSLEVVTRRHRTGMEPSQS
jgi:hypothetical protein